MNPVIYTAGKIHKPNHPLSQIISQIPTSIYELIEQYINSGHHTYSVNVT